MEREQNITWRKENIPMGENDSRFYEGVLRVRSEDWKHKKILDLGTGKGGIFDADLKRRGINADIISFSLHLKDKRCAKLPPHLKREVTTKVAGNALALPFKDSSFDMVVSVEALPYYLNSLSEFQELVKEIKRVLKRGGEARMWPLSKAEGADWRAWRKSELKEIFKDSGLEMEIKNPKAGFGKDGVEGSDALLVLRKKQKAQKTN